MPNFDFQAQDCDRVSIMTVTNGARVTDASQLVTLPQLVSASGLPRHVFQTAMDEGLIQPTPIRRGRGGGKTFTQEDAIFVLTVAALAIATGVALVALLRVMRETGATVDGGAITIKIPTVTS